MPKLDRNEYGNPCPTLHSLRKHQRNFKNNHLTADNKTQRAQITVYYEENTQEHKSTKWVTPRAE